jgi:glycosyltransferase involved in cell wall biosynthesis
VRTKGRKVVYCHNPARWLYQGDDYLGSDSSAFTRAVLATLRRPLVVFDQRAARSVDTYLCNSRVVRDRIKATYGIDAEVLPAPTALDPDGTQQPLDGIEPGYFLCVSRLLPYKNVAAVMAAFAELDERLVVVGDGPERAELERRRTPNTTLVGTAGDEQLRWLYANSRGLVAASREDYGLTPLEALAFGRPAAALRAGGFLDTIVEGQTGLFFDEPEPTAIAVAVTELGRHDWDPQVLAARAEQFSEATFIRRLHEIVGERVL